MNDPRAVQVSPERQTRRLRAVKARGMVTPRAKYLSHVFLPNKRRARHAVHLTDGDNRANDRNVLPDGISIAFLSKTPQTQCLVMTSASKAAFMITACAKPSDGFKWSPNSQHIAYREGPPPTCPNRNKGREQTMHASWMKLQMTPSTSCLRTRRQQKPCGRQGKLQNVLPATGRGCTTVAPIPDDRFTHTKPPLADDGQRL